MSSVLSKSPSMSKMKARSCGKLYLEVCQSKLPEKVTGTEQISKLFCDSEGKSVILRAYLLVLRSHDIKRGPVQVIVMSNRVVFLK